MGPSRYLPAEDTFLLRDALEPLSGGSCLEIGFGSGAILASVSARFALAAGTDLVRLDEARLALMEPLQLVIADRATCFRDRVFDLVFFNPPYLPSESLEDRAVDGGPTGIETALEFLEEGSRVLRDTGVMMVLLSEDGDVNGFVDECRRKGFAVETAAKKRVFFETLTVLRLARRKSKAHPAGKQRR